MWIDTIDCVPIADGEYWVQTVYGDVSTMSYTYEFGWNTSYRDDGTPNNKHAMENDGYIARWHKVDYPPAIPKEWKERYFQKLERKENE